MEKMICSKCGREVLIQDYVDDCRICIDCYISECEDRTEQEARENCR